MDLVTVLILVAIYCVIHLSIFFYMLITQKEFIEVVHDFINGLVSFNKLLITKFKERYFY